MNSILNIMELLIGDIAMTMKEIFSRCKEEINPKINYIRKIKGNKFVALGSSGCYHLIKYFFTVRNNKLNVTKIEENTN